MSSSLWQRVSRSSPFLQVWYHISINNPSGVIKQFPKAFERFMYVHCLKSIKHECLFSLLKIMFVFLMPICRKMRSFVATVAKVFRLSIGMPYVTCILPNEQQV